MEWLPDDGPPAPITPGLGRRGAASEDVVEQGRDRQRFGALNRTTVLAGRPRLGSRAVTAACLGLIASLAVALVLVSRQHMAPPRGVAAPAAEQVAMDHAMAMVVAGARTAEPLHDFLRNDSSAGACALVPIGTSPPREIGAAIARALPGYRVRDYSRTIDQFTALCAIRVRAMDAAGSVLVVDVVSPQSAVHHSFTALTVGARMDGASAVSVATALTTTGWSVVLGTVGPLADEPSSSDLQRLSQDAALLW